MNTFKYFIRALRKQKVISSINIFGLSLGFACCIIIFLYLKSELSYDNFNVNKNRIYRLIIPTSKVGQYSADVTYRLGHDCKNNITGVEQFARLYNLWGPYTVSHDNKTFKENNLLYTDPSILNIFTFTFIEGENNKAFEAPNTVIITKSISKKYFGKEEALGKTINLDNISNLTVAGVVQDFPHNSHFHFDFLVHEPNRLESWGDWVKQSWNFTNIKTYVLLSENYSEDQFYQEFQSFVQQNVEDGSKDYVSKTKLQNLSDIHLYSNHILDDFDTKGNINIIIIFFSIAICILLIACINYLSLSISNISKRMNEINVRRIVGAKKIQLLFQHIIESIFFFIFSLLIAILFVKAVYPFLRDYINLYFEINELRNIWLLLSLIGVVTIVAILSGLYISNAALKHKQIQSINGIQLSKDISFSQSSIYLLIQFSLSIILIICSGFIFKQLSYVQNTDLGYNKDSIVLIPLGQTQKTAYSLKESLLKHPQIKDISIASSFPPNIYQFSDVQLLDEPNSRSIHSKNFFCDYNYTKFLDLKITEGRNLSIDYSTDENAGVLVNKTFVKEAGWDSSIGKRLKNGWNQKELTVVGVVNDFHFKSLHEKIEPAIISIDLKKQLFEMGIKLSGKDLNTELNLVQTEWRKINPQTPFDYQFLDEKVASYYKENREQARVILLFSILAIIITCLGLIATSILLAKQRTKEIGIRKVNGARVSDMMTMLNKDFLKWVVIAFVIACPIAWYSINKWLQNFAYKTELSWWIFALAGLLALGIALLTVSWQSWRAATRNPVEALRYE